MNNNNGSSSVDNMLDDGPSAKFGVSNLDEKQEMIEKEYNAEGLTLENIGELGGYISKFFREDISSGAHTAYRTTVETLTPGFVRRMRNKKIYIKQIAQTEEKLGEYYNDEKHTIASEIVNKKVVKEREQVAQKKIETMQLVREEVREVIHAAKEAALADSFEKFHERRRAQVEEVQEEEERLKRLQEEQIERDAEEQRRWRMSFYGDQAKLFREELASKSPNGLVIGRNRTVLDRIKDEWEEREDSRVRLQVERPSPSKQVGLDNHLGVFAPERRGAMDDDLFVEELDTHDIHPLSAGPSTRFEAQQNRLDDTRSRIMQQEELYKALDWDLTEMKEAVQRMQDMKEVLEKEQRQISQELMVFERIQTGPPKRLPIAPEIPSMDMFKQRAAQTLQKLRQLEYALVKAQQRRDGLHQQSLSLAKEIAVAKDALGKGEVAHASENYGLGYMPVIVGKHISEELGIAGKPKELLQAVTHKSRHVAIQAESEIALKLHKETGKIDREIWTQRLKEEGKKADLEGMISRIARISEKLQRSKVDAMRLNLADSLKAFLGSGLTLTAVHKKIVGTLPWYKHLDFTLSQHTVKYVTSNVMGAIVFESSDENDNVEAYSNGLTLGHHHIGYACGVINLPKDCLWSLSVTVTKQGDGEEYDHHDETDFVSVKIGPSIHSLGTVGIYHNKVNAATGTVLYDVKHVLRGDTFAFRFDFSSSSRDVKRHLAVCTGIYEEYEMADLEIVSDPKYIHRTRVLSSYVKVLRVEESSGRLRETRLLEELISLENSTARYWDSPILSHTLQRFEREYFLRILKAEILLQQEQQRRQLIKKNADLSSAKALMADADLKKEGDLEQSKKKYLMMKRNLQRKKIDDGRDLVGKRLILWDKADSRWRYVKVMEYAIEWIENGLVAVVTHKVQEHNEGLEDIGQPLTLDLSSFKFFISPVQELDQDSTIRWREKKGWETQIATIQETMDTQIAALQKAFDKFQRRSERETSKNRKRVMQIFERNIDRAAEELTNTPESKQKIKDEYLPQAMLDVKRGIIPHDSRKVDERTTARQAAKERFMNHFKDNRRRATEEGLVSSEAAIREEVALKQRQMNRKRKQILNEGTAKIQVLKEKLRKQYYERRQLLTQQLTFPPEVFAKVTPQAFNCEHLRTKAWGDLYSHGVKCMICGRELSELHEEESQVMGYGSGADRSLWAAVQRHRDDEATFRVESAAQLQAVESERMRLEKERRDMEQQEVFFYDYQDLKIIYDFDVRHKKDIKAAGVFRQGLQWTEDELLDFETGRVVEEKLRILNQGLPETLIEDYDPLREVDNPPPTFRAMDERHRAQYRDFLYQIGRLHNFRRKIYEYKIKRFELLTDRDVYSAVLESLHRDSFVLEIGLQSLELDLDRTSRLLSTFEHMQQLWQQATLIQSQAVKDKKKAEMARVGVWEDVQEQFDKVSLAHEEMRQLLKARVLTESKVDEVHAVLSAKENELRQQHTDHSKRQDLLSVLQYCMPGNLVHTRRFGHCYIISYRQSDDMLLVNLPFGRPLAKAYLHYREVVEGERVLQQAESRLMGLEDESMQAWYAKERIRCKKECYLMQREEEQQRQYYSFVDLSKNEDKLKKQMVGQAVSDAYQIANSKKYHQLQQKHVNQQLDKLRADRKKRHVEYIGPPNNRPRSMSAFEAYRHRKVIQHELMQLFVEKAAGDADRSIKEAISNNRSIWIRDFSFTQLIDGVVLEMIHELVAEAYTEGRDAKIFSERKTGVYYPSYPHMQYGVYSSLSSIWQQKKETLRRRIQIAKGEATKLVMAMASGSSSAVDKSKLTKDEVLRRRQAKRDRRQELIRQRLLCEEMRKEEILCRDFYRWELKENLRERRLMKEEERLMQLLRIQEIKMKKEAEEALALLASGSVGGADGKDIKLNAALSAEITARRDLQFTYERRRKELKDLAIERRHREEDQQLMVIEDELSKLLREIDLVDRQRATYIAQFGEDEEESQADASVDAAEAIFFVKGSKGKELNLALMEASMRKGPMKIPEWLVLPHKFETWTMIAQNRFIKTMIIVRNKQKIIEKKVDKEEKRLVRLEDRSYKDWEKKLRVSELQQMEAELKEMEAKEAVDDAAARLRDLQENITKIAIFCREKGEEELRMRAELKRRESLARQRDEELKEADEWLQLCQRRARNRDKLKRKVSTDCHFIDTDSINGFHQRFSTTHLRARLYSSYFKSIVSAAVNRAEIIASERHLMRIQHGLSANKVLLLERGSSMQTLMREMRSDDWMRMRRSVLNERFFPKNRKAVLISRFMGWLRYYYWNKGHQDAFKLKAEVIRRQLDIDRMFKQQLGGRAKEREDNSSVVAVPDSLLRKVRERPLQCKQCLSFYLGGQNHSMACGYHAGTFIMQCPPSCPTPGLTTHCAAHRKRRWTCCLDPVNNAPGCARKYHCPPPGDPLFEEIMNRMRQRDGEALVELDEKLVDAREMNYPRQVQSQRQDQLREIEEKMVELRTAAERFGGLKFV